MSTNYDKFMVVLPSLALRHKDAVLDYYDELRARIAALEATLHKAWNRMDNARAILTNDNPTPNCNWGILDTKLDRAALENRENDNG